MHPLSRATTYLESFSIRADTGEHEMRSYATGFFIRADTAILLVTNWHVVTGLDPSNPSFCSSQPPHYLKATVFNKLGGVSELSLKLYGNSMAPLWFEHPLRNEVDLIVYQLPLTLEDHFDFFDIQSAEDNSPIDVRVGKDVFVLGYPFNRKELCETFGEDAPHYLPIWKRGSIATEPAVRLNKRVLLIDSLSRAGMSGSPIVVAEDVKELQATNFANSEVMGRMKAGDKKAFLDLDMQATKEIIRKKFRFLGVYSGSIGRARLAELALGKCWHLDVLLELLDSPQKGSMPYHAPVENEYYDTYFARTSDGKLTIVGADGAETKHDLYPSAKK